jgi:hypothetical protein
VQLTKQEINQACEKLREILTSQTVGEFSISNKIYVEIYAEPRRE